MIFCRRYTAKGFELVWLVCVCI